MTGCYISVTIITCTDCLEVTMTGCYISVTIITCTDCLEVSMTGCAIPIYITCTEVQWQCACCVQCQRMTKSPRRQGRPSESSWRWCSQPTTCQGRRGGWVPLCCQRSQKILCIWFTLTLLLFCFFSCFCSER